MISELVIGGKSRPVRLGMAALAAFEDATGKDFLNGAQVDQMSLTELAHLLRVGLIAGARISKIDTADIPEVEGILDWLDEGPALMEFPKIVAQQMSDLQSKLLPDLKAKNGKGSVKS